MGLDSYWRKRNPLWRENEQNDTPELIDVEGVSFDPPLKLLGGMFSAGGEGSFRGKAYAAMIETITGVDIYQEFIDNMVVRLMAFDLDNATPDMVAQDDFADDLPDLRRMFRAYADAGAGLAGWW